MRLLLALALLLLAAPLQAATYWVSPTGGTDSTVYSGADTSGANARALSLANSTVRPGDVVRFKSGAYTAPISPTNSGSSSSRIRYYGFPQDPGAVRVTNVQFGRASDPSYGDYCTARWVTTTSAFTGNSGLFNYGVFPRGDSIVACRSAVGNVVTVAGNYHVYDSLTVAGTNNSAGAWIRVSGGYDCKPLSTCSPCNPVTNFYRSAGNQIKNSTFTLTRSAGVGSFQCVKFEAADSTVFFNNTVTVTLGSTDSYFFGLELYNCDYSWVQGNTWTFTMSGTPAGARGFWSLRDWSTHNRFLSNTLTATGSGAMSFMLTNSGSCSGSVTDNYFGYNTLKVATPQTDAGMLWFQNGLRADTLEFNKIATSSTRPLLTLTTNTDNFGGVIRHNTFFTAGPVAVDLTGGTGSRTSPTLLASNIFYCQSPNSVSFQNVRALYPTQLDSAGVFFSLGAATAANAIYYGGVLGAPGSGGTFGGAEAMWCSPRLVDSTYAAFDGRATSTGCAVSGTWHDGYAGAAVYDPDATPPAVSITFPADTSYTWSGSETMPMTWTASDAVGVTSIVVQYGSTSDPAVAPTSWNTLTTLGGGVTSYNWIMASVATRYGFVRVLGYDAAGNVGSDSQVYKFNPPPDSGREGEEEVP